MRAHATCVWHVPEKGTYRAPALVELCNHLGSHHTLVAWLVSRPVSVLQFPLCDGTSPVMRHVYFVGIVQKVFSEKASAIARMRQKCVRNASKWVLFIGEKRNVQNASEMRQNCVQNASKMRGTPLGENTFWTIPILVHLPILPLLHTQRALRDILMSRGKNCLPIVSRQFLTRNYPRPNRLLKCLPNCLSPTGEGIFSSFKITPAVRVIARQLRDKNCPGAIFAPGHQDVSQGPLGIGHDLDDPISVK